MVTPAGSDNALVRLFLKLFGKKSDDSSKHTTDDSTPKNEYTYTPPDTDEVIQDWFEPSLPVSNSENFIKMPINTYGGAYNISLPDADLAGALFDAGIRAFGQSVADNGLAGTFTGYSGTSSNSSSNSSSSTNYTLDDVRELYPDLDFLTDAQLEELLEEYGGLGSDLNIDAFGQDYNSMLEGLNNLPTTPIFDNFLNDARSQIAAENAEMYADLDNLLNERTASYEQQLANLSENYDNMRAAVLSRQYRQNNQLMDTLQSSLDRSRRNALEAGATAGVRIAGDINTLLSVQNKQAATSMETANQLSQMMINQRNAESDLRNSYNDYLSENTYNRHSIKLGSEDRASSLANTNYNSAQSSYNAQVKDWDNKYFDNPFYDYRNRLKPKYSTGTGGNSTGGGKDQFGNSYSTRTFGKYGM